MLTGVVTAAGNQLKPAERFARDRLEPLLGSMRPIDVPGAQPGLHDFETGPPGTPVAAIEVTSEVDGQRNMLAREAERHLSALRLPGSPSVWYVWLGDDARIAAIEHEILLTLLRDVERAGRGHVTNLGDYRDPFVLRARDLGIQRIHALTPATGHAGSVYVTAGSYWGFGWDGPATDSWLRALLASPTGVNKLDKLARATTAAERHLVIVPDLMSKPGIGVSLALRARDDRDAPDYGIPSVVPPDPLTHLWLLPTMQDWQGFLWTQHRGWEVVDRR
jgi:hypothetical protein